MEFTDVQEVVRENEHVALGVLFDQPAGVRVEDEAGGPVGKTKSQSRYLEILLTWTGEQWDVWDYAFPKTS